MIEISKEDLEKLIDERVLAIINKRLQIELNMETERDFYSPGHCSICTDVKLTLCGEEFSTASSSASFSTHY